VAVSERIGRATLARVYSGEPPRDPRPSRRSTLGQRLLRKLRGNELRAVVVKPHAR
jgi:hypothetical protein